jgi:hypothetical protein
MHLGMAMVLAMKRKIYSHGGIGSFLAPNIIRTNLHDIFKNRQVFPDFAGEEVGAINASTAADGLPSTAIGDAAINKAYCA